MDEHARPTPSDPQGPQTVEELESAQRRDFLRLTVTAVAGLTIGAGATAEAQQPPRKTITIGADTQAALDRQLDAFGAALKSEERAAVSRFFAPNVNFRSSAGFTEGWSAIADGGDDSLRMRGLSEVYAIKWLSDHTALVDGGFELDKKKGWTTEIWMKGAGQDEFLIRICRVRFGDSLTSFETLTSLKPTTTGDGVPSSTQEREEAELRQQFRAFRQAFNNGDVKGVVALADEDCDASCAFAFIAGRAQILNGRDQMEGKAGRLLGRSRNIARVGEGPVVAPVSYKPGADVLAKAATYLGGEAKLIQFLSPTVVVVDGTAEIHDIPSAHGFAPSDMRGVYTNVWCKNGGQWLAAATRGWFDEVRKEQETVMTTFA